MRRYSVKQKRFFLGVLIFIFLFSLIITITETFKVITWRDVFNSVGLSDFSSVSDSYDMSVHFIDVGKADSIYIKCLDKNILIDAGEKNTYDLVNEYLRKQNVKKLDLVIATHPHSDHIGGMSKVIDEFEISKLIMPEIDEAIIPTSTSYEKFLNALQSKNILVEKPVPGSEFQLGEMSIQTLAPNRQYDNVNNNSVVVKVIFRNRSFLFTGDAEKESEEDMLGQNIDLKSDILKVGHHGSKTSTSDTFLNRVNPEYAVISVGEDKFKLPKKATIDKLKRKNIKIYRTDIDGTVIFSTDGNKIFVFTEKNHSD